MLSTDTDRGCPKASSEDFSLKRVVEQKGKSWLDLNVEYGYGARKCDRSFWFYELEARGVERTPATRLVPKLRRDSVHFWSAAVLCLFRNPTTVLGRI